MKRARVLTAGLLVLTFLFSCATTESVTKRDKTAKGAGIGAAAGAVGAIVTGKREADEILAGAAIGAAIGGGVGAYMDHQEAKLAKIPGTHVERLDESTLLVHFDSDVLFAVDSAALSGDARNALGQAASVMNEYDKTAVIVQGHTDSTGTDQHNQGLSERRAGSVQQELISRGVDRDRIASMGFGESQPVADNATSEGRRRNRRVDVMLRAKAK
jgi:outer membrane protein OmpA-like peptidoglycan-associated protein